MATVTGTDALGTPVPPDQATADVNVINPQINVVKSADKTVIVAPDVVVYTYIVANPGDDPLSNVVVSDNKCSPLVYQGGDANNNGLLDPSETWTYRCTTTLTQDTLNTVTATGVDSLGNPVVDTDDEFVDVVAPRIEVIKTANPTVTLPGGAVQYTYLVRNTGDAPLTSVALSDNTCAPISGPNPGGDANNNGLLDPGETWAYTCVTTVVVDTTNTVTASGQPSDPNGQPLPGIGRVEDQDTAVVNVVAPGIQVVKAANPTVLYAGETVVYTYTVTNTGDTPLANVGPSDDKCSPLVYQGGDANNNGLLDTTETWTYTCSMAVTIDTTNVVVASGTPSDANGQPLPGIPDVRDDDTKLVNVINPSFNIVKTPSATQVSPGTSVIYRYEVTNTGDDPLSNLAVTDDKCSPLTLLTNDGNGLLDPGETWVYECTAVLNQDTLNTATATATDSLGSPLRDEDTAFVDVIRPGLQIDKLASDPIIYSGQTVTYTYTVRNTGTDPVYQRRRDRR